jgi:hypothetical protein
MDSVEAAPRAVEGGPRCPHIVHKDEDDAATEVQTRLSGQDWPTKADPFPARETTVGRASTYLGHTAGITEERSARRLEASSDRTGELEGMVDAAVKATNAVGRHGDDPHGAAFDDVLLEDRIRELETEAPGHLLPVRGILDGPDPVLERPGVGTEANDMVGETARLATRRTAAGRELSNADGVPAAVAVSVGRITNPAGADDRLIRRWEGRAEEPVKGEPSGPAHRHGGVRDEAHESAPNGPQYGGRSRPRQAPFQRVIGAAQAA